jgi:N-acetylmuramoyl-L-alanine amidase
MTFLSNFTRRFKEIARNVSVAKPVPKPVIAAPTIKAANEAINAVVKPAPLPPITHPTPKAKPMPVTGNAKNIKRIAIHCTATREGRDYSVETIRGWHKRQGWSDIGYHFVIGLDGTVERGRPEHTPGSHVRGFNAGSIGIVYVGGLDAQGKGKDTRTPAQKRAMADLVKALLKAYPGADVLGHRDHSPDLDGDGVIERHEWLKECPCFDVRAWWASVK